MPTLYWHSASILSTFNPKQVLSIKTLSPYDMDDPSFVWPAWKFDMKRGDLFTKLHEQYNTYPCPIQDADAFHHDICEISHEANSTAEFHRLVSDNWLHRDH